MWQYNELYHHGIKGQKWGVRRYQNPDGTRTEAGLKRARMPQKTKEQKESEAKKRKDVKNRGTLTGAELKEKVNRLEMEKRLKDLTELELDRGKKETRELLISVGKKVASTALAGAALYGLKAAISKKFDVNEFANAVFNGGPKKK